MGKKGQHHLELIDVQHLFVGKLPPTTTRRDVYEAFSKFGAIRHHDIKNLRNGLCAFITYVTRGDADGALHGHCGRNECIADTKT